MGDRCPKHGVSITPKFQCYDCEAAALRKELATPSPDDAEREAQDWWEARAGWPLDTSATVASLAALLRVDAERGRRQGLEETVRECEAEALDWRPSDKVPPDHVTAYCARRS